MAAGVLNYGGAPNQDAALANFPGAALQRMSVCTTPIELLSNDGKDTVLAHASGFFWRRAGRPYLVTNYHVISGRNVFTGEVISQAYLPLKIAFYGLELAVIGQHVSIARRRWIFAFNENFPDLVAKPPMVNGQPVDVWAAPLMDFMVLASDPARTGFEGAAIASSMINDQEEEPIATAAGDDCFIIGYPLRNYEGMIPPIWKRGSLASDTLMGIGPRPAFFVDAATTKGMSGSPIVRRIGGLTVQDKDRGVLRELSTIQLIGIYAGRLESRDMEAVNLGYGWYRTLIDPVIDYYNYQDVPYTTEQGGLTPGAAAPPPPASSPPAG